MGQSEIQEWTKSGPSKIFGPYHFKFFKGCLPQILLGQFLSNLPHMKVIVQNPFN